MASVLFVVWAAVYLVKAVSKDIGVRGEGMALLGSMMERWDGIGLMMDGGMADDAATTIAVPITNRQGSVLTLTASRKNR